MSQTRPVPPGSVRGSRPAAQQHAGRRARWCGARRGRAPGARGGSDASRRRRRRCAASQRRARRARCRRRGRPPRGGGRQRSGDASSKVTAPPLRTCICCSVLHRPMVLTRTAVYQAGIGSRRGIRSPRGRRSAADGRTRARRVVDRTPATSGAFRRSSSPRRCDRGRQPREGYPSVPGRYVRARMSR